MGSKRRQPNNFTTESDLGENVLDGCARLGERFVARAIYRDRPHNGKRGACPTTRLAAGASTTRAAIVRSSAVATIAWAVAMMEHLEQAVALLNQPEVEAAPVSAADPRSCQEA